MIAKVQDALHKNHAEIAVDGIWGPKTQKVMEGYTLGVALVAKAKAPVVPPASQKPVAPPPTANFRGSDTIPFPTQAGERMKTRGAYSKGWPKGAVVHYTAGSDKVGSAMSTIKGGVKDGYTYLCIDADGNLIQAHPVSQWGYHAGQSAWKGYVGGLNDEAIGIEICSPGLLTHKNGKYYAWYDKKFVNPIPENQRRYVTEKEHGCPTGWYKKFSAQQEATLFKVLQWLKANDPSNVFKYENVVGHHECAGLKGLGFWRKSDPGGCLSLSLDELRGKLIKA